MPNFAYRAKSQNGATVEGVIEAPDINQGTQKLRGQKFVVLEISEKKVTLGDRWKQFKKPSVKSKDLVLFSRQLSTLVSAGVPIVQGLTILEEQAENPSFREVLHSVRTDIEGGLSIAEAMKKHPNAFPDLYVAMIKAGEVGGILDVILERLSAYLESSEALKAKVKSAMMYPAVVCSIAGSVTVFLLVFVIPTFATIFESFGAQLPTPTAVLISISYFMKKNVLFIIASPFVGGWAFKKFYKTPKGQRFVDYYVMKAPIFGIMLKKVAVAKFTRTLGTLIKSGVPIMQGLETVAQTAGNVILEDIIMSARESIREGSKISDPLKKGGIFPPMVIQMIAVGEETGSLDTMLTKIADFYDQEVDTAVKGLTSMIEPIIIVVMGIVIGAIVICMFLPMFELGSLAAKAG